MKRIILAQPKKRGFRSLQPKLEVVNCSDLEITFTAGAVITPAAIVKAGLLRSSLHGVKVLGGGTLTKAFTIKGCTVSIPAKAKIEAAGGTVAA